MHTLYLVVMMRARQGVNEPNLLYYYYTIKYIILLLLIVQVVVIGGLVVERLYPPGQARVVLQTGVRGTEINAGFDECIRISITPFSSRVRIAALHLRDFYVPHAGGGGAGEGEGQVGGVAAVGADVHVH